MGDIKTKTSEQRHRALRASYLSLSRAIDEADVWRGALTGDPDPGPLEAHDRRIAKVRRQLSEMYELARNALA